MIGWFTKHLNWTVVIFTVCSNVISYYLVELFLIITNIPFWGPVYPPNAVDVLLPGLSSFAFDAELILADILLIIGFNWILVKKQQNKAYLWFFIAFLVVDLPVLLSYTITFDFPSFLHLLRYIAIWVWFAGWIILMSLKNESNIKNDTVNPGLVQ